MKKDIIYSLAAALLLMGTSIAISYYIPHHAPGSFFDKITETFLLMTTLPGLLVLLLCGYLFSFDSYINIHENSFAYALSISSFLVNFIVVLAILRFFSYLKKRRTL